MAPYVVIVAHPEPEPLDGAWGEWSEYSDCTATCGGGEQTRTRQCDDPAPEHGGLECPGLYEMTRQCGGEPCESESDM